MSCLGTIGAISSFQRRKYDAFYWKIDEFSKLSEGNNNFYYSPDFHFKDQTCDLKFFPNGKSGESAGFFGLYLRLQLDSKETSCVHVILGFKTQSGRIEKGFNQNIIFSKTKEFGAPTLIRRSEFLKRKQELAPSDCLTFVAFLSPDVLEIIRDVSDRTKPGHAEEIDGEEKSEKKGGEKVLVDMAKLLTSGDNSDAMIVVEEDEFKVHSCILATRTPVFAALFEHDTLEKATRKITITDCEPAVFKEFLNHIYTGSVQNLTAENALGLYRVADKYLVKDLKEVCREYIQDNLCLETFCEAVQLALKCEDEELLESAFDFCATNFRLIIRSVEWQRYIKDNPIEANEVLIKSFGHP